VSAVRSDVLSGRDARWLAIGAQGLGSGRPRTAARQPALIALLDRLGAIQLDAVNVLERTQFLVPFSRLGPYDRGQLLALTGPGGAWFEYWGHAASLQPVSLYPLFRPRMAGFLSGTVGGEATAARRRAWLTEHADYVEAVRQEVVERGPLAASQLSEPRRRVGEWWGRRSDGRRALELLFAEGVLAAWRSPSFERHYDLTERVIPRAVLELPTPTLEEAERELIAVAASALGVATVSDLADYFWVRPLVARRRVSELVEAGRLVEVAVEGWRQPGYLTPAARLRRPRRGHGTLLSPFDSLIWTRERTERLFGMRFRIEIYVPRDRRTHGYYVLPFLVDDRLAARFDLKADRRAASLSVVASHLEPGVPLSDVVEGARVELATLAAWLGLERVVAAPTGDLGRAISRSRRE
jgi:hypothetical protein